MARRVDGSSGTRPSAPSGSPAVHEHDPARGATDDALVGRPDFWVLLLRARAACTVLLPVALAAFPVFGPDRVRLACAATLSATVANLVLLRRVRRHQSIRGLLATFDVASVLAVIAVAPAAYSAGTVLLVSIAALYIFWFGGRHAARILVPSGVALLAIGLWHQPDGWMTTWLAWLATGGLGAVPLTRMAAASVELRNRHDELVNGIDATVWESVEGSHDATFMSDGVTALLGYHPEQLSSFTDLLERVVPEDRDVVVASRERAAAGRDAEVQYGLVDAWGGHRHLHERIRVSRGADGRPTQRRGIIVDETARWEAERSVRGYADFVEGLHVPLAILRLEFPSDPRSLRVVVGNAAAAALVGQSQDRVVGRRLADLMPLSDLFCESLANVALHDQVLEQPYIRIDHLDAVFALRAIPLPDRCIGLMLEDVTDRANQSRSLQHQATHDHLTGLPNRARFNDRLTRALERETTAGRRIAVLMVDLNQFKEVNDSLGHEVGDLLLTELARRLSSELRYCDTIARLGGDEFAVLLTDSVDEASSLGAAHRVAELCEEPFEIDGFRLQVGASVGVARAPEHGRDARTVMRHADHAMYRAKDAGGGVVVYSPIHDREGVTRFSLLEDLRAAVDTDQVVLHYQPRVEVSSGDVMGVEALVRWSHPRHGLLSPVDFIELAEVSGEIGALTRTVTSRAVADLAGVAADAPLVLGVNLSARSLRDPGLVAWVASVLEGGIGSASLCFEISESQLMEDPGRAAEVLAAVRALGVRISVDDYGTGGSSVTQLGALPIDEVKIDPRFVADVGRDPTVVRSMINLCHNLGIHVVAEGVESQPVLDVLRDLGCDSVQGFHLAPPMPLPELATHLASHARDRVAVHAGGPDGEANVA